MVFFRPFSRCDRYFVSRIIFSQTRQKKACLNANKTTSTPSAGHPPTSTRPGGQALMRDSRCGEGATKGNPNLINVGNFQHIFVVTPNESVLKIPNTASLVGFCLRVNVAVTQNCEAWHGCPLPRPALLLTFSLILFTFIFIIIFISIDPFTHILYWHLSLSLLLHFPSQISGRYVIFRVDHRLLIH